MEDEANISRTVTVAENVPTSSLPEVQIVEHLQLERSLKRRLFIYFLKLSQLLGLIAISATVV